jgi:hypothetical protein
MILEIKKWTHWSSSFAPLSKIERECRKVAIFDVVLNIDDPNWFESMYNRQIYTPSMTFYGLFRKFGFIRQMQSQYRITEKA